MANQPQADFTMTGTVRGQRVDCRGIGEGGVTIEQIKHALWEGTGLKTCLYRVEAYPPGAQISVWVPRDTICALVPGFWNGHLELEVIERPIPANGGS